MRPGSRSPASTPSTGPHGDGDGAPARQKLADPAYIAEYEKQLAADAANPPTDDELLNRRLTPDPAKARVRVRVAVHPQDVDVVALRFDDPRLRPGLRAEGVGGLPRGVHGTHLDLTQLPDPGVAGPRPPPGGIEGVELVQRQIENAMQLRDAIDNHPAEQIHGCVACAPRSDSRRVPRQPHRATPSLGPAEHDDRLGHRRIRVGPVTDHAVHREHRLRRRHLQTRAADGPARCADQQDIAKHRAVHDQTSAPHAVRWHSWSRFW